MGNCDKDSRKCVHVVGAAHASRLMGALTRIAIMVCPKENRIRQARGTGQLWAPLVAWPIALQNMMTDYKARRDACRPKVLDKYEIIGFISSGTYGRVYKAKSRNQDDNREFAIKKFKPDREGETHQYTGISQSAAREIAVSMSEYVRHKAYELSPGQISN